jgi:uncharacterized protein YkwD
MIQIKRYRRQFSVLSHPSFVAWVRLIGVALLGASLASCASAPMPQAVTTRDWSVEALGPINAFRAEHGLKPVSIDSAVIRSARRQAMAMASAGIVSHDVAGSFDARMRGDGFAKVAAAENVGAGEASVTEAIERWKRSPGHRANLLMKEVTRIGMVRAEAAGTRYRAYWALVLVGGS